MPLFHDDAVNRSPGLVVSGSIAVELDWALAAVHRPEFQRDHAVLERVYSQSPQLAERARSFWRQGEVTSCGGSIELMILAHHGGLLSSGDPGELLARLEGLCANAPADLRLASETAEDRTALLARLKRLRSSPEDRRRYVELVADVWSALAPDWERDGRLAVRAAVAARNQLRRQGASWREVAAAAKCCDDELMSQLVGWLGPEGTVVVVPAYFAHLGSLVDLPGTVMIGVRADGLGAQSRARTEQLARCLKTISDPTRLAMLEAVRGASFTVSELAAYFSLAQPTVSNHVKLLREAGVLSQRSEGGRRVLEVQPDVLTEVVGRLTEMFALPGPQPGS